MFAAGHIRAGLKKCLYVDRAYFNYETESFVSKEYTLPVFVNDRGEEEYIILTPLDILREGEPSINRADFYGSQKRIRASIDNDVLRAHVNNYICKAVRRYEEQQRRNKRQIRERTISKIEKDAFAELTREYPELYDYYIRLRELDTPEIRAKSISEVNYQLEKLWLNHFFC